MRRIHALACACLAALAAGALPATAGVMPPSVYTSVEVDRLAYRDAVHRAGFRTAGMCIEAADTVEITRGCSGGSVEGTVGSARLGFDVQRFVEAAPVDVPAAQSTTAAGEQLVRVDVDVFDGGGLLIRMGAVSAPGVSATPVDGSATQGGRIEDDSVVWDLGTVEPGTYEVAARFTLSNDPQRVASYLPQVTVQRSDLSRMAVEHHDGGIDAGRTVMRFHTLTLRQHVGAAHAPPRIDPGTAHADEDAPLAQAWGAMPSFVARGAYYEPNAGVQKTRTHGLEELSPGAAGRANVAAMGWSYWSPQPGAKVEPVAGFAFDGDGVLEGFTIGLKTAGYLRYGVSPQSTSPIYDGDGGSIGVTASAGAVHARSKREPARPGGRLHARWDGSAAVAWTDLGQTMVPMAEPNATSPASSTFTEPSRLLEAGVPVYALGGDVDNRTGDEPIAGKPIVLRERWAFAAIATSSPRGSRYQPVIETTESELRITPTVRPGGYMLENERLGWDLDWAAFHSLGWLEYAARRTGEQGMVKTYSFPHGATSRIDVFSAEGVHEVLRAGPGLWRLTMTGEGADLVRLGRTAH